MSTAEEQRQRAPLCVLVVDDSPIMRKMVIRSLEVAGFDLGGVEQAAHGGEALGVLERVLPDLMLCDVHMPAMDGVQLVRTLAKQRRIASLPVVMISSERNDAQRAELLTLGARGYLHKPFYPEALGEVVRQVLRRTATS